MRELVQQGLRLQDGKCPEEAAQAQIDVANQALGGNPDYPTALLLKAKSLAALGRWPEVLTIAEQAKSKWTDGSPPADLYNVQTRAYFNGSGASHLDERTPRR